MKYTPLGREDAGRSGYQQQVKEANIKRIFDLVRQGNCRSRAEIVRCMKLSATSVSVLVDELSARGLIEETGPAQTTTPGRRPISLRLNSGARQMAVFALSREDVQYTLLDLDCQVVERLSFPLSVEGLPQKAAEDACTDLFEQVLRRKAKRFDPKRALMIGISLPGLSAGPVRGMTIGFRLSDAAIEGFQARIGLPVYQFSSTRCMAYAEKRFLDAADPDGLETEDLLYVDIRQSINMSVIYNGIIFPGPYGTAGRLGHFTVDHQGRPCPCGSRGCLERYIGWDALLADARQACAEAGVEAPEDMAALGRRYADEPALRAIVMNAAHLLAAALYSAMCGSGICRVVLSGVECLGEPFLQAVREDLLRRPLMADLLALGYAQVGPDAQSIGLAQHYLDKLFTVTK